MVEKRNQGMTAVLFREHPQFLDRVVSGRSSRRS
jgi:hypothetical protein